MVGIRYKFRLLDALHPHEKLCQGIIKMAPVATTLVSETKANASVGALGRTKDGRPLKIRSYPKFSSLEEERQYRKQHLAAAYRIFAERGLLNRRQHSLLLLMVSVQDSTKASLVTSVSEIRS